MTDIRLSPRAISDLESIWDFTADRWDVDQADRYVRNLYRVITTLADMPELGLNIAHIRSGYRKHATGAHLIFYRPKLDGIDVVRILHQSMDIDAHL
ncbi:MAG: type II toxin-antitoxin system RelE/ParE family toxin [Rhodospirillaceae bacterium]|nr:type II toxin-antitoxin system RelE/ParE family toxin [Rhodospirillaceae bacterium]